MKVHEFSKLESKLQLRVRNARDRLVWFEHEGIVITRTKRSHGNKEIPASLIRQQLRLNEAQLAGLLSCSFSRDDYIQALTAKGLINTTAQRGRVQ